MNRRGFLKRASVVPVAIVAGFAGLQPRPPKRTGEVSLVLNDAFPPDGHWYEVDARVRASNRGNGTFDIDYAQWTRPRSISGL